MQSLNSMSALLHLNYLQMLTGQALLIVRNALVFLASPHLTAGKSGVVCFAWEVLPGVSLIAVGETNSGSGPGSRIHSSELSFLPNGLRWGYRATEMDVVGLRVLKCVFVER